MKDAKDMTREEMADILETYATVIAGTPIVVRNLHKAARMLRNSIDRPTIEVEVVDSENDLARVNINYHNIYGNQRSHNAHTSAAWLRKALGMEGGAS